MYNISLMLTTFVIKNKIKKRGKKKKKFQRYHNMDNLIISMLF